MDSFFHIQGNSTSPLAPLILIHAVSGFALPYLSLGPLSSSDTLKSRAVYGLSSPIYESRSYHLPTSFYAIAREYVNRIRREIPHGPYILGGWSMGGMIAIKMADIFESEGEEVLGVVLIDSTNPEGYPTFHNTRERDEVAEWTYKAYAARSGLPNLEEMDYEKDDILDRLDREDDKDSGLGDEDDDEVDFTEYLPRMRKHIYNGFDMIARVGEGGYLPERLKSPVTLVKCTQLAPLPKAMSAERKKAIRHRFQDERAGWTMKNFRSIPLDAQHDDVFDRRHLGSITDILKKALEQLA